MGKAWREPRPTFPFDTRGSPGHSFAKASSSAVPTEDRTEGRQAGRPACFVVHVEHVEQKNIIFNDCQPVFISNMVYRSCQFLSPSSALIKPDRRCYHIRLKKELFVPYEEIKTERFARLTAT